ncbi:MerR family transcriptional regulator [Amycolatopsis sp. NPDC023774]|uniref:MerR family transcriptional regulator n=1 Tax=Amycolatopsis sp. NPDC023774 TaxID=3155015 RepID=UPI00340FA330
MGHRVGEVAVLAGITVRTLHHYDEIGLLSPSGRTAAGYRRYSEADLDRLQRVLLYRELGFPRNDRRRARRPRRRRRGPPQATAFAAGGAARAPGSHDRGRRPGDGGESHGERVAARGEVRGVRRLPRARGVRGAGRAAVGCHVRVAGCDTAGQGGARGGRTPSRGVGTSAGRARRRGYAGGSWRNNTARC